MLDGLRKDPRQAFKAMGFLVVHTLASQAAAVLLTPGIQAAAGGSFRLAISCAAAKAVEGIASQLAGSAAIDAGIDSMRSNVRRVARLVLPGIDRRGYSTKDESTARYVMASGAEQEKLGVLNGLRLIAGSSLQVLATVIVAPLMLVMLQPALPIWCAMSVGAAVLAANGSALLADWRLRSAEETRLLRKDEEARQANIRNAEHVEGGELEGRRSFETMPALLKEVDDGIDEYALHSRRSHKYQKVSFGWLEAGNYLGYLVALASPILLSAAGVPAATSVIVATSFGVLNQTLKGAFQNFRTGTQQMARSLATARSRREVEEQARRSLERHGVEALPMTNEEQRPVELIFEDVGYWPDGPEGPDVRPWQLRGVSFRVALGPGSLVITRPSGVGKSAVAALLAGRLQPKEGRVVLRFSDGRDVDLRTVSPEYRARLLSEVFQDGRLVGGTLREAVGGGRERGMDEEVRAALAKLDLPNGDDDFLDQSTDALSGGQRRRMALVAATLRADPPILVVDEPTEGLNSASVADVDRCLASESERRLVIQITHDLARVVRRGGRVIVLDDPNDPKPWRRTASSGAPMRVGVAADLSDCGLLAHRVVRDHPAMGPLVDIMDEYPTSSRLSLTGSPLDRRGGSSGVVLGAPSRSALSTLVAETRTQLFPLADVLRATGRREQEVEGHLLGTPMGELSVVAFIDESERSGMAESIEPITLGSLGPVLLRSLAPLDASSQRWGDAVLRLPRRFGRMEGVSPTWGLPSTASPQGSIGAMGPIEVPGSWTRGSVGESGVVLVVPSRSFQRVMREAGVSFYPYSAATKALPGAEHEEGREASGEVERVVVFTDPKEEARVRRDVSPVPRGDPAFGVLGA